MDDIKVSVICNAYNHEKHIKQALDSFVMQKTNFDFEILVHDDASTDRTADIIREYEIKYPNLIKPIYQTENQYSKKIGIIRTYQLSRAKGKYFALCEGDDYWTDPYKLQKQYDALENNPQLDVCANKTEVVDTSGNVVGYMSPSDSDVIFDIESVIQGGGGFVATNSLMFRTQSMLEPLPLRGIVSLDYVWQIQGALRGGMLYLSDCMSAYRRMAIGSWTSRMSKDPYKMVEHIRRVINMLESLDEITQGQYHEVIDQKIKTNKFHILELEEKYKEMLGKEYRDIFKKLSLRKKSK